MRRIFVDTEWTAVPWSASAQLLWIGLSDEQGQSWCGLSSDARVDPENDKYVSDLLALITPEVPRLPRGDLATAVRRFCGEVDELWAWIPTLASFASWSNLGDRSPEIYERCRDIDLQMLRCLIDPWPPSWPKNIHDLNAAAMTAGVQAPPRAPNHLHPRVHAEWNRELFKLIRAARQSAA